MPKQSKLGDDAFIYQPHKQQSEKEKLRELSFKGKLDYLRDYYKFHALAAIVVIALIIYFVYEILNPSVAPQFYAAMINNSINSDVIDQLSADFADKLQLNPERESVELNTTFNFGADAQYTATMTQVLSTYMVNHEIDVMIAPESIFKDYANNGFMSKLSDQLPTDIYSSLTDQFYLTNTEDDPEKSVYGIYLTNTKLYQEYADNSDPYVLGIIGNAPHEENTIEFIRYLFDEE